MPLNMLIRQFEKQHNELPIQLYLDIKVAYNSVNQDVIWLKLQHNLPSALFHLLRHMFDKSKLQ